jgi:RNA polymerase sigma factor (sigma-70 family)
MMNDINEKMIDRLQSGDSNFYKNLYKEYYPSVEKFVVHNSGTINDAKDIFQDTLIVLIEKIRADNFTLTASLKTYIIAISKNLWFKKLRNNSNYYEAEITESLSHKFFCEISSSIEKEKTYWEKLQEYLSKITTHCNHLLQAMFFKNKNIEEIQLEYGYSSKHNAQNQKHKCIQQLRKVKEANTLAKI